MKTLSMMLCVLLTLSMLTVAMPVSAAPSTEFRISEVNAASIAEGEEFTVTVSMGATSSLAMVELKLRYDRTVMEAVSATKEGYLASCVMSDVNIAPVRVTEDLDQHGEVWITGLSDENETIADGEVIAAITFKATSHITASSVITAYYMDAACYTEGSFSVLDCSLVEGGVVITEETAPTSTTASTVLAPTETTTAAVAETTMTSAPTAVTVPGDAAGANVLEYRLSTVTRDEPIAKGETFTVQVSVSEAAALSTVGFQFRYDKSLMKPISSTKEGFLGACLMSESNIAPVRNDLTSDQYGEVWITGMSENNASVYDGEVLTTITFQALADITDDSVIVGYYTEASYFGEDGITIYDYTCRVVNGGVVIGEKNSDPIPEEMLTPADKGTKSGIDKADEEGNTPLMLIIIIGVVGVAIIGVVITMIFVKKRRRN